MSAKGPGEMAFIDGNMNAPMYKDILKKQHKAAKKLFGEEEWKFQQDNDPKHTSKLAQAWLQEKIVEVAPWAASNPDMNVQENLQKVRTELTH